MRGAAPVSAGASDELARLSAAIAAGRRRARAARRPTATRPRCSRRCARCDGDAGAATAAYLDLVGYRLLDGFDISGPLRARAAGRAAAVRSASPSTRRPREATDVEGKIAEVRAKVPEEHREEFDELLAEARLDVPDPRRARRLQRHLGIRDHAPRRARRGPPRSRRTGASTTPEHIVDAGFDEMRALVVRRGAGRRRRSWRSGTTTARRVTAKDAPPSWATRRAPPPDPSGLPPAAARVMRAMGIVIGAMFGSSEEEHEERLLRGLAASRGVYEGPARRVSGPAEFDRIEQGDVLVTESTTEAFNILLPLLGAIVTDSGGLLSHAAIVAREYGIPGVVGTREATERDRRTARACASTATRAR